MTRPTPRRLLKLIERAQLLREEIRALATGGDEATITPAGVRAYDDMITALDALHDWHAALRPTSREGGDPDV